jgi:type IV pilus assembly protein PilM
MAKKQAVWGIDIGLCSIKALRCVAGDTPNEVFADKFDFIEFPKMLNQSDVDAEEEIRKALELFLSRNNLKGDMVAISVPGQMGLPRFFRPPPVDIKTLPEIVKYEVKQQIPFPIDEVVWDWQRLGGVVVDDRIVDAEVGLFAMKREAVFKAMKPFDEAGIEIDFIQLSPLAVFNFVTHDVFEALPKPEDVDPENPPESMVIMSMGTDTTDLIVTNGIKLWLRNIPVGGNHFTKQLSRELKLTHAKAEQLKRNAKLAEDPKSLFRAMRPVFNDLVNEVQRSLTFFRSIDKNATLSKIVLLGNSAKLPGLRQFLTSQLEMDIAKVSELANLKGPEVVGQATFDENVLTFAPAYGLCIQGLNQGVLKTNLIPAEIKEERFVRAKKPWILAAISMMMLGMVVGWFFYTNLLYRSSDEFESDGVTWGGAKKLAADVKKESENLVLSDIQLRNTLDKIGRINNELISASDSKNQWIELMKAIHAQLPKDPRIADVAVDPLDVPFQDREVVYIQYIESHFTKNIDKQIEALKNFYEVQFSKTGEEEETKAPPPTEFADGVTPPADAAAAVANPAAPPADAAKSTPVIPTTVLGASQAPAPVAVDPSNPLTFTGPGWVIEIKGHHYHNSSEAMMQKDSRRAFLLRTLLKSLNEGTVTFPGENNKVQGGGEYRLSDFGLYFPTLINEASNQSHVITYNVSPAEIEQLQKEIKADEEADQKAKDSSTPVELTDEQKKAREMRKARWEMVNKIAREKGMRVPRYDFTIQMIWIPRSPAQRFEIREQRLKAEAAAKAAPATPPAADE